MSRKACLLVLLILMRAGTALAQDVVPNQAYVSKVCNLQLTTLDVGEKSAVAESRLSDAQELVDLVSEAANNCGDLKYGKEDFQTWFATAQQIAVDSVQYLRDNLRAAIEAQKTDLVPANFGTYSIFLVHKDLSPTDIASVYASFKLLGTRLKDARAAIWLTPFPNSASHLPDYDQDEDICQNTFRLPNCNTAEYVVTTSSAPTAWKSDPHPVVLEVDGLTAAQVACFMNEIVQKENGELLTASNVLIILRGEVAKSNLKEATVDIGGNVVNIFLNVVGHVPTFCGGSG